MPAQVPRPCRPLHNVNQSINHISFSPWGQRQQTVNAKKGLCIVGFSSFEMCSVPNVSHSKSAAEQVYATVNQCTNAVQRFSKSCSPPLRLQTGANLHAISLNCLSARKRLRILYTGFFCVCTAAFYLRPCTYTTHGCNGFASESLHQSGYVFEAVYRFLVCMCHHIHVSKSYLSLQARVGRHTLTAPAAQS